MYGKVGDKEIRTGDFFILRESFPALRRTVLKDFHMILSREGFLPYVNHIKTTNEFERQGRRVSFFSADNEDKIHGPQNTIFWINEATAVSYNIFFQLYIRNSLFCFLDYNPMDPESWVRELEQGNRDPEPDDISLDVSTVHDNPHLPAPQMKAILNIKDKELRNVYLKGDWTKLTGLVFPHFEIVESLPDSYSKVYWGLDFGWKDQTALVECRQIGNDIYIRELLYETECEYQTIADTIYTNLGRTKGVADSAEPRSIQAIQNKGIRVRPVKKSGKHFRVEVVKQVRTHNLFITKDSTNLIKELKTHKFKKVKNALGEEVESNEPIDYMDHLINAMEYAIITFSKRKIVNIL
jgi:PBSX family phage terminase large subunit